MQTEWRKTAHYLLPAEKPQPAENRYDIYPAFDIGDGMIFSGFESIANEVSKHKNVIIDGYAGVFYGHFIEELKNSLRNKNLSIECINVSDYMKDQDVINKLVSPFLGNDDPVFGTRTSLEFEDFFDMTRLATIIPSQDSDINIIFGPGAALAGWEGQLLYIDIPKNEIQFRSRAGSITNLGMGKPADPGEMYKHFYFIDWVVLNSHKKNIAHKIDILIDGQGPFAPTWIKGCDLRRSLKEMSQNVFRVRPWFEPGPWGGTWIRDHIPGLSGDVPNYAWSFELIVPENGLLLESSGKLLEVSFDFIMYLEGENVLGECHDRFGDNFPIRFDFLDTFDGGNLSIQCHPRPEYMKEHFGEAFTQEETYYILDTKDNAQVYLGFHENIDPALFNHELQKSYDESKPVNIEKYVQKHPAARHDLFLIPYGTIHGSGKNNLVLEISTTPYIFTFKMYDWLRPGLDGKPRPLNIQRGMDNLFFHRKGNYVKEKLISRPVLVTEGDDWKMYHLPTHETHLYDVHRYHFKSSLEIHTEGKMHVLSLVEGVSIEILTKRGFKQMFSYAETFVIPAAAESYRIKNNSSSEAILVKAFIK
jgi:mannose-6-phosphate isomerase class I